MKRQSGPAARKVDIGMVTVNRHETFPAFSEEQLLTKLDGTIENALAAVAVRTAALNGLLSSALRHLGHRCVVDPMASNGDTWDSLLFAADVASAIFTVATAEPGTAVELRLGERVVPATATGPAYFASASTWLTATWLAYVARDEAKIRSLAAVPMDVLRAGDPDDAEYVFAMVDMLSRFGRQEPGTSRALNTALRATDPAGVPAPLRDYVVKIVVPQLELFHHLAQDDHQVRFNRALVEAVESHREFWTATDEQADSPFGFIALGPLALACFARGAGTRVDVESEYLPARLLDGIWPAERAPLSAPGRRGGGVHGR